MSLDENDPIVKSAVFGRQVEDFLNSEIGQYLIAKAEEEAELANDHLKRVYPWRTRKIQQLQNRILVAESIQQWLADAIMDGHQALGILEDNE